MNRHRFIHLLAVGMLLAGAATPSFAQDRTYLISPKLLGPAYWSAAQKGAEQAATDLNVTVIYNASTEADSAKQINLIQDMLQRDLDGIGVSPNDADAVVSIIKRAADQDIPVVTFDSDAPASARQYFVGPATGQEVGRKMAEFLVEQIGGKGDVAFMVAGLGAQNIIDQTDGAKEYLKDYPDINIVTTVASNDDSQRAFANAQNLLQTYPGLSGIMGFGGAETPAAAEVVEQAVAAGTLPAGQIKIAGIGVPSLVSKYLKDGTLTTAFIWDPAKMAYATVYLLDQLAQGKPITDGMDIPTIGTVSLDGPSLYIGILEVTADNVDSFSF